MCLPTETAKKIKNDGISVRHFQPQDEQQVKDLFAIGILSNADAAFWRLCRHPPNLVIAGILGVLSFSVSRRIIVALLMEVLTFGLVYRTSRKLFHGYVNHSLQDDLSNIPQVYGSSNGCFLVATDDATGRIVGTVGGQGKGPDLFELRRMSVDANCQGQGLGRRLLQRLHQECKNGKITLSTTSIQYAAHALYRKNGYAMTKRMPLMGSGGYQQYLSNLEVYVFEKEL